MIATDKSRYDASIVVISFKTRDLTRQCLTALIAECLRLPQGQTAEIIVLDNASGDGSAEMIEQEFSNAPVPVCLMRSDVNLGFAGANNRAMLQAKGRYLVLLNSDAFFHEDALAKSIAHMNADLTVGIGGARLVGPTGNWQPSARSFHNLWNDFIVLIGLQERYPKSKIFGAPDRTWADPAQPASVDWVPGAFSIIRREALAKAGIFDEDFFLYYEEVDLCRRVKQAGFRIMYWPDIVVTHLGGESSKQLTSLAYSNQAAQVVLWRMRATLLYYRKHFGAQARLAYWMEQAMYALRVRRNRNATNPERQGKVAQARQLSELMRQAWQETNGGRVSPPRPW